VSDRLIGQRHKTDLFVVLERDLTYSHTSIFLEIRPWCVDDRNIVLLVAWRYLASRALSKKAGANLRLSLPLSTERNRLRVPAELHPRSLLRSFAGKCEHLRAYPRGTRHLPQDHI
jgi:hypothetical protein